MCILILKFKTILFKSYFLLRYLKRDIKLKANTNYKKWLIIFKIIFKIKLNYETFIKIIQSH